MSVDMLGGEVSAWSRRVMGGLCRSQLVLGILHSYAF